MKRALTMFILAISVLAAACSGSGSGGGTSVEPISPDSSSEASQDTMSPAASPY
jgi:hypothetical protein